MSDSFDFNAKITCITGENGSGKTNLLDAIYYLCYTKSYFTSYQHHIAQKGSDGFRVAGIFTKGKDTETIICKWKQGKKEVLADDVAYENVSEHIGKYAAVIIAPDDIKLINDGSELRRKWVDGILSQTDKKYFENLMSYQRVLQQRNAWLKRESQAAANDASLEFYNDMLATTGTYIYEQRTLFLEKFAPDINDYYHRLSGGKEKISLLYVSDLQQKKIGDWLKETLQTDLRAQRTTHGIHRDDWSFLLDDILLRQYGSQGQKKSFVFALKLAQFSFLKKSIGHIPILLLDDIFEKLDQSRIQALLRIIGDSEFEQVVLTDTHAERIKNAFGTDAEVAFIKL